MGFIVFLVKLRDGLVKIPLAEFERTNHLGGGLVNQRAIFASEQHEFLPIVHRCWAKLYAAL